LALGRLSLSRYGVGPCDATRREDFLLELLEQVRMLLEVRARIVATLTDALTVEREPGAALLNDVEIGGHVDDLTRAADTLAVKNVELHLAERSGELVLHHFHPSAVSDDDHVFA